MIIIIMTGSVPIPDEMRAMMARKEELEKKTIEDLTEVAVPGGGPASVGSSQPSAQAPPAELKPPAFINKMDPRVCRAHIVQRPGFGRVLQLTQDVRAEEDIVVEAPKIIVPKPCLPTIREEYARLTGEQRTFLRSLNSHQCSGHEEVGLPPELEHFYNVLCINAHTFEHDKKQAVYEHISMVEHSCCSNASYIDVPSMGLGALHRCSCYRF